MPRTKLARDVANSIHEYNNPRYNATEDLPLDLQKLITAPVGSPQRDSQLDQSFDKYAEDSPIAGNWSKLMRVLGRGINGGNQK